MDNGEIMRQRKIGKQLMLVEIIHQEKEKVQRGGISFVDRGRLASWAAMTKEEIDDFVDVYSSLDPFEMAQNVAKGYAYGREQKSQNSVFMFLLSTYHRFGCGYYLDNVALDSIPQLCEIVAPQIYAIYTEKHEAYPVDSSFGIGPMLEKVFLFYLKHFIVTVDEALSKGYDWDVIVATIRKKLTRKKYQELKDYCATNKN